MRLESAKNLKECFEKIQSGSNDCTVIDLLEQRLKPIFNEECQLLKYYTSRQSMAPNAATESVQNLSRTSAFLLTTMTRRASSQTID